MADRRTVSTSPATRATVDRKATSAASSASRCCIEAEAGIRFATDSLAAGIFATRTPARSGFDRRQTDLALGDPGGDPADHQHLSHPGAAPRRRRHRGVGAPDRADRCQPRGQRHVRQSALLAHRSRGLPADAVGAIRRRRPPRDGTAPGQPCAERAGPRRHHSARGCGVRSPRPDGGGRLHRRPAGHRQCQARRSALVRPAGRDAAGRFPAGTRPPRSGGARRRGGGQRHCHADYAGRRAARHPAGRRAHATGAALDPGAAAPACGSSRSRRPRRSRCRRAAALGR